MHHTLYSRIQQVGTPTAGQDYAGRPKNNQSPWSH